MKTRKEKTTNETSNNDNVKKLPRLYTTKQAALEWGISYWSLRELVLNGKIRPIIGIGKGWMFDGSELDVSKLERL